MKFIRSYSFTKCHIYHALNEDKYSFHGMIGRTSEITYCIFILKNFFRIQIDDTIYVGRQYLVQEYEFS